jgi:hypothetical protein
MSPANPDPIKLLPGGESARGESGQALSAQTAARPVTAALSPARQLSDLPKDELEQLARELGLEPRSFRSRQHLVAAIHERRQVIAGMDRDALLDVIRWARRPVLSNLNKEQLAQEVVRIHLMRFAGLSQRGLVVLARLRGVLAADDEPVPTLIRKLKRKEGLFSRINRKRRAMLGSIVSNMIGESGGGDEYQFIPPDEQGAAPGASAASIKEEIEEAGLFGGIAGRIKRSADAYLNQKLDEIEARIDRKLDEIDRRLAEWRDKEIANRIRILKITLWATVIVGVVTLIYQYIKVYFWPH